MNSKKFGIIVVLLISLSATACALGARDRACKAVANVVPEEIPAELAIPPNDDPLLFMRQLTGHDDIIKVHGDIDIARLQDLLEIANLGETDSSGRRYFAYAAHIRAAPATMMQRYLDSEIALAKAARELNQGYEDDKTFTIALIGRRQEKVIPYMTDRDSTFGYGVYYIFSAIPFGINTDFHQFTVYSDESKPDGDF